MSGPSPSHGLRIALDYGPLIAFFVAVRLTDVFAGTLVFMIAITLAVVISKWRLGRVSPMLWLSAVLVIGFGGLTLYLHDQRFIQIKPTVIYMMLSAALFFGVITRRPLIKYLFEASYQGIDTRGWALLTRNWAWWFAVLAIANEATRAMLSFDTWLTLKVWAFPTATLIFGTAHLPMLMRHGLMSEAKPPSMPDG